MTLGAVGLEAHLATGLTRVCRCWSVTRRDGVRTGFTDHDRDLVFGGLTFRADTGMSARSFQQADGLSVDNTEAIGILRDPGVREADIAAGRYDGAMVEAWLVHWEDTANRKRIFRGTIGEIARSGGAFRAELRGLAERLNQPGGRIYQRECTAVVGDTDCGVDLSQPGYALEAPIAAIDADRRIFELPDPGGFDERWFDRGAASIVSGAGEGLVGLVKNDTTEDAVRRIELWAAIRADISPGDVMRLTAGCDKRAETCRSKFLNFLNFRGFPNIPGEDWLISYPKPGGVNDGGSLSG